MIVSILFIVGCGSHTSLICVSVITHNGNEVAVCIPLDKYKDVPNNKPTPQKNDDEIVT